MSSTPAKEALRAEVAERLGSFKLDEKQQESMARVRALAAEFADRLIDLAPIGRELSASLTALEESKYWANQAIARSGGVA